MTSARPTRRAWGLLVAGGVLMVLGRVLGVAELFPLGLAAVAVVGGSCLLVRWAPLPLEASRRVVPVRAHAGTPARVDLHLRNVGRRPTPVLTAADPFDGGRRWARFRVAPLEAGAGATSAYRVPTDRRGVFSLGPLALERTDPLGLFVRGVEVAGASTLTVYPHVDRIAALPHTRGNDPRGGTIPRPALGAGGDEFHALRPYVVGDDLRRVHWASSARSDDLLIRQDDLPWQGRATVVVDLRASAHTDDTFEAAMSAAASTCLACGAAGLEVRLVGTDGTDTGFGSGRTHEDAVMERLAAWKPDAAERPLAPTLGAVGLGHDTTLAVITSGRAAGVAAEAAGRTRRARGAVVVALGPGDPGLAATGAAVVRAPTLAAFPDAWRAAFGPADRRTAAAPRRTS